MNIRIDDMNPTRKAVVVSLSEEEIRDEHASVVREIGNVARIPGFRPGKAPAAMVEKRFTKEIQEEMNRKILSKSYRQALEKEKLEVFSLVEVKGEQVPTDAAHEITYIVDVQPDFTVPEYTGIETKIGSEEVTDDEIAEAIEGLRRQRARFEVVDRPAVKGDYIKLSYEGRFEDQPVAELVPDRPIFGKQSSTWEEAGAEEGAIPGFAEALVGLKAGDKKDIPIEFPSSFTEGALAGKKTVYSVEIQEVRESVLPELNEEFFKSLGVENEEDLRKQMRQDLEQRKKQENFSDQRRQISDAITGKVQIDLPETAVESETQSVLRQIVESNIRQGVPPQKLEEQQEQLLEGARETAESRVKLRFLLGKIAEKEKITVENEDLQRYIMQEAMMTQTTPDKLVKDLRKDENRIRNLQQRILFDKTLDFLVEKAKVTPADSNNEK